MTLRAPLFAAPVRRLALAGVVLALSLLSCGREITGPGDGVRPRIVSGLSFLAEFPGEFASLEDGAGSVVSFNRVLVIFRRGDGTVALARLVDFPANLEEVPLNLTLTLSNDAPAEGETFEIFLRYLNADNDTVFAGGPVEVLAVPRKPSDPPPAPAQVPLTYTGPGNDAVEVWFDQDTITVLAGNPFAFTAEAQDALENVVADAPLVFTVLDAAHATLTAPGAGAGTALAARGLARVRVALAAGGAADTAHLVVLPRAGALQVVSGNAQTGTLGSALPDSIAVRVLATDFQPLEGVSVGITVTAGGGTVSSDTLVSDATGIVRFAWTLGALGTAQTVTVGSLGLTSVSVTATAQTPTVPTELQLVTGADQIGAPGVALPTPIQVRLVDANGVGVPGTPIAFTAGAGSSAAPDTAETDVSGFASTIWTLANSAGTQVLWVKAVGTSVDSIEVHANEVLGPIVTTTVTPALDTLVSIGETKQLTAASNDAALNPVVGTYTWTSDSSAIATVSATGVVTAVGVGAAWIVAEETGGTKDSARIVVDQQLSSVVVTPGAREIYLGTSYDFNASAVDGLGVPLLVQPSFEWATVIPSVATIDTATGVVQGVGLGSTQVQATANGITGVANLTVKTAILRIAVVRDSVSFVTTDTFTIQALGRKRSYRAIAYDTLDAPMPGITFAFQSSNPSVALFDSTGSATARAAAVSNGVTSIRALAQGVQGSASLTVAQRLASITLTPGTPSIGPLGVVLITARGRDPDGTFLPSLSGVTFSSAFTAVATVHPTSGLVTGVAVGTTYITAVKDTITSDSATVTVGGAVDPIISFGRDTLSIGRSATNLSIPVYLSKPHVSPVTVSLAVVDTFAFFTQASITIAAGATSGNAQLNGRSAGLTQIIATDIGGGGGYAPDTANLAVQASVRFTSTSYSLVATNEAPTQVLLTDPAPAGGTYITYQYGTPGRASVSPDPAFIPQGQLSVNVVILALAGGGTTVTPSATGVSGTLSTVNTYPAALDINAATGRLGANQLQSNLYVQTAANLSQPLAVTLTSTDTNVVKTVSSIVIAQGIYYSYFDVIAGVPGTARIVATAPGFTPDSVTYTVTTPRIDLCCANTRTTTDGPATISVTAEDSVGSNHPRVTPLLISFTSSDTTIVQLSKATTVLPANAASISDVQYSPGGEVGTAWIHATAAGHFNDSILITVNGPDLTFNTTLVRVGLGQRLPTSVYVQIPNNTVAPRTVYLQNSNPAVTTLPDSVIIPAGTYYAYISLDGLGLGTTTFSASTAGHDPDTMTFVVTPPILTLNGGGTFDNFRPPVGISTNVRDSVGSAHARIDSLHLSYVSTDTSVITVTPTAVILPGTSTVSTAQVSFHGVGTAQVIVSAPGHPNDTISFTVVVPKLSFSFLTYRLGRRQRTGPTDLYVQVPDNVADTLSVTITQTNGASDSLSTLTPNIPAGIYYSYIAVAGLQYGVDTLIASAPNYLPDTAFVVVTPANITVGNLTASRTTTSPNQNFTMVLRDSIGSAHQSMDTVVVHVVSSNPGVMQPLSSSYRILPGTTSITGTVDYIGPGTAFLTISDSLATGIAGATGNTVTVTGPSLTIANGAPKLGMRQNSGPTTTYVYTPDNVVGTPLTVYLASTDPTVVSVPDSVIIPVGTYYAYFTVTAHDAVGTVQINASAVGYSPDAENQEVTAPRFLLQTASSVRTTQVRPTVTVRSADADGTVHPVNENVVVKLVTSAGTVGYVDSAYVTIAAGQSINNTARFVPVSVGSIQLSAEDERVESYKYGTGTVNVAVTDPALSAWGTTPVSLAPGQYSDEYVYVPDTRTSPLLMTLTHTSAATSSADTLYMNTANSTRLFRITALGLGPDTIAVSAPAHTSVKGPILVGAGRVDGISSWPTTLNADSVLVTLYARAPNSNIRYVTSATTFNLAVDAHLEFRSGVPASAPLTSVTIPADAQSVAFWVKRVSAGLANVSITSTNYTTYSPIVTVNAP